MSAWRDLPNAAHIDRVIASLKTHPDIWTVWGAAQAAARDVAWKAAWSAVCNADRIVDRPVAWSAAWSAVCDADRIVDRSAALDAAWSSTAALIAWDDSVQFLDMSSSELEVWARLSNDPQAILLLPTVRVFEQIKALEAV